MLTRILLLALILAPAVGAQHGAAPPSAVAAIEEAILTSSPTVDMNDRFGSAVAVQGDLAIIGAPGDGDAGDFAGAAYVYSRASGAWQLEAKITGSTGFNKRFGVSVALDGDTALIGATGEDTDPADDAGAVFVFTRSGTTWTEQARLSASDGTASTSTVQFGNAVALEGDVAVIGAAGDGDANAVRRGAAYVFTRSGGVWTEAAKLTRPDVDASDNDRFGTAVAIQDDRVFVSTPREEAAPATFGRVFEYTRAGSSWTQTAELVPAPQPGLSSFGSALAADGDRVLVGANLSNAGGAAFTFVLDGGQWVEESELRVALPPAGTSGQFGGAVALDGDTALVSSPQWSQGAGVRRGAVYVFTRSGAVWTERDLILASDGQAEDQFGSAVGLADGRAMVGAPFARVGNETFAGKVYALADLVPVADEASPSAGAALSAPRPNPAAGRATLNLTLDAPQAVRATLHDALGRTVAVLHDGDADGTVALSVDASALAPGVYVVRAVGERLSETRRLTVAR